MMGTRRERPLVVMLGTRGFPDVQGGIERHAEALAPLIVERGWDVEVIGRSPYLPPGQRRWRGVTITPLWAPKTKSLETIIHTTLGLFAAWRLKPDLLHIHAVGPALLVPLARTLGLRVVVTHHGYDYDRSKWNGIARALLRLGERLGMQLSQLRIAVSANIATAMQRRYGRPTHYLPNGVTVQKTRPDTRSLERYGLAAQGYVLTVSRLVPEKRQLDLIAAYARLRDPAYKLVIVGGADHPDAYERLVLTAAAATSGVVTTGFLAGAELASTFAHAGMFVLPSSHEGMPIALLEALSHGLPVLASDIEANLALGLPSDRYFPLGDIDALAQAIEARMGSLPSAAEREAQVADVERSYGWAAIADATVALYASVLPDPKRDVVYRTDYSGRSIMK